MIPLIAMLKKSVIAVFLNIIVKTVLILDKQDSGLIAGSLYLKGILTRLMRINYEYDVF